MAELKEADTVVGLMLYLDACDKFEQTGKIVYLAKVCFEYPIFQRFFIEELRRLEDPKNYPYVIKKQVEKLRERKPRGRPKMDPYVLDMKLTYIKFAVEKHEFLSKKNGEHEITKKELIRRVFENEVPEDSQLHFADVSQSTQYALFDRAKSHEPQNEEFARQIYNEMMPFDVVFD